MHPYQMQSLLRDRHKDEILALKRGSLYHAIGRLVRDELIAVKSTGREGRRPERTTYRIPPAGRKEFMPRPSPDRRGSSPRAVGIHGRHELPRPPHSHRGPARLEERAAHLEERDCASKPASAAASHVLRINLVESEYLVAMLTAELAWVRSLVADISSGKLAWDFKTVFKEARASRSAAGTHQRSKPWKSTQSPDNASQSATDSNALSGPIWTLLILAPVIARSSADPRASVFSSCSFLKSWCGEAALCWPRTRAPLARRRSQPPLLGLALSVAEEFIIQQTSIAPLPFPGANADYARFWGINWVYLLFMLGFESVWVVLVPVQVTELIFPTAANSHGCASAALSSTCIAFLIGSRIAWYGWTQQARPSLHAAPYHPPAALILVGLAAIAVLIFAGYCCAASATLVRSVAPAG